MVKNTSDKVIKQLDFNRKLMLMVILSHYSFKCRKIKEVSSDRCGNVRIKRFHSV